VRKRVAKWLEGLNGADLDRIERELTWERRKVERVRRDLRQGLRRDAFRLQQQGKLTSVVAERAFFDD
jgi:hypothetical protein